MTVMKIGQITNASYDGKYFILATSPFINALLLLKTC
jgi:hypothetical protein